MQKCKTQDLFMLDKSIAKDYLINYKYPWQALLGIKDFILFYFEKNKLKNSKRYGNGVVISPSAKVDRTVKITPPCFIDDGAEIRPYAVLRGGVIVGKNAVVGSFCEIKNSVLFDEVKVPHFNYVGDSILGYKVHLGAGVKISNQKSDKSEIKIINCAIRCRTGLKKAGAFLGDYVEIGCNSVLNPGTVIGKNTTVYPCVSARGVLQEDCIYKNAKLKVKKV